MAFVIYDGKKIVPAPFISVQKEYVKSAGGTKITGHTGLPDAPKKREGNIIGSNYTIQISGTLVASMLGSPQIDGTFYDGSGYPDAGKKLPQAEETLSGVEKARRSVEVSLGHVCGATRVWVWPQTRDSRKTRPERFGLFRSDFLLRPT